MTTCSTEECTRPILCRGLCKKHYDQLYHLNLSREQRNVLNEKRKKIYYANREQELAKDKEYSLKNRNKKLAYYKQYYEDNKVRRIAQSNINAKNRRAFKISTRGDWVMTQAFVDDLYTVYANKCAYCGKDGAIDRYGHLTIEHVIPLSRGGTYSEDNIIPACSNCNDRKQDMLESECGMYHRPHPVTILACILQTYGGI